MENILQSTEKNAPLKFDYPPDMVEAAKYFVNGVFGEPLAHTANPHFPVTLSAALMIITGTAWVQPIAQAYGLDVDDKEHADAE